MWQGTVYAIALPLLSWVLLVLLFVGLAQAGLLFPGDMDDIAATHRAGLESVVMKSTLRSDPVFLWKRSKPPSRG